MGIASSKMFWSALPSLLWFLLSVVTLVLFGKDLKRLFAALTAQLRLARLRVGPVEIEPREAAETVVIAGDLVKAPKQPPVREDADKRRCRDREARYDHNRRLALVHKLFRSQEAGQLYDILIYLIPAHQGTLASVERVEYYFGGHGWGDRIFPATDRSRGFPILTAAYGPLLCTAEVFFTDGTSSMVDRFLDFEMGLQAAPQQPGVGLGAVEAAS